jgi:exodeoxyribonuclease VII large subunit
MPDLWSVSELNRYVKQSLEMDYRLQDLRITGEVSGFRAYPSGHWYFTLKDSGAQVSCVMWRGRAERQRFTPRDGDAVIAAGAVSLYEVRGQYQLDVALLLPTGEGVLFQEFMRLRARLEAEGLFAPERKRPIPAQPRRIAVVTSLATAALRDILNIIRRRYPLVEVIIAPTPVQGQDAPPQIVAALKAAAGVAPDVIILARGGGALEDLWCFNDERVARAIVASPVPVVSGVGHETDFTIADFAADLRAPTPSAAAELVTPDSEQIAAQVADLRARLTEAALAALREKTWALAQHQAHLRGLSPQAALRSGQQHLDDLQARAAAALGYRVSLERERWHGLDQALNNVNPLAVLARGYAVVTGPLGQVIRSVGQVQPGDELSVRVSDGSFGVIERTSTQRHKDTKTQRKS